MGKLAVVFVAIITFQAVLGGVTKDFSYDREELKDVVREIVTISDNIYEVFQKAQSRRGFSWKNLEFPEDVEEIIALLEELPTKSGERKSEITTNILRELRGIRSILKELQRSTEQTTVHTLEINLITTIKKVVKYIETFGEISDKETTSDTFLTVLKQFRYALKKLYQNVNTHALDREERHRYGDEASESYRDKNNLQEIVRALEITLERVHTDDVLLQQAFEHLVKKYFDDLSEYLTPDLYKYYARLESKPSVAEIKTQMSNFIKSFLAKIEHMPDTVHVAFSKATRNFENHLNAMTEINTPKRLFIIRMQTFSDLVTNWYESFQYTQREFKQVIEQHTPVLVENMRSVISKVEKIEGHPEILTNLRKIASRLDKNVTILTYILVVQETTTEVRKLIMIHKNTSAIDLVGSEYFKSLERLTTSLLSIDGLDDIETYTLFMMAQTNTLSLYLKNGDDKEIKEILMKSVNQMLEILKRSSNTEYSNFAQSLENIKREFVIARAMISNYFQKISLELNLFVWKVYEQQNQHLPKDCFDIMTSYMIAMDEIHSNQRIIKALETVQTPQEISLKTKTVAEQLVQLLHIIVPGFEKAKLANRVHYFKQILEVVTFRLSKIPGGANMPTKEVYERLREIQGHLVEVLERPDLDTNVNLGVYIQSAVHELQKLAFEQHLENDKEIVKLYGDFLFGLEYIVNKLQIELQYPIEKHSIETWNLQIGGVATRISQLLQRSRAKPELHWVILLQVEALAQEMEPVANVFKKLGGNNSLFFKLYTKYNKMYEELLRVTKMGWNKSFEDLCSFLDTQIATVVWDLAVLVSHKQETPEFYDVYKYVSVVLSNIMVRLENVHNYEYYDILVNTQHLGEFVQKLASKVSTKLENKFVESEKIKYDVALSTLMFAYRLEYISFHLKVDTDTVPKGLYRIDTELHHIASAQSANELKTELKRYVRSSYNEIAKIVQQESTVGAKTALMQYIIALEKLYFTIDDVLVRSNNAETIHSIFTRVDMQVNYLTQFIEYLSPNSKVGIDALQGEHRRLLNFITVISKNLNELREHSNKYEHFVKDLTEIKSVQAANYRNIDELKVKVIEDLRHFLMVLKQLSRVLLETHETQNDSELSTTWKKIFDGFLTTIQRMHIEIETNVLVCQRASTYQRLGISNNTCSKVENPGKNENPTNLLDFEGQYERESSNNDHTKEITSKYSNDAYNSKWEARQSDKHAPGDKFNYNKGLDKSDYDSNFGKLDEPERVTKTLKPLLQNIQSVAHDVTSELKDNYDGDVSVYVRELMQFIDFTNKRYGREVTEDDTFKRTMESFQQIKGELKDQMGSTKLASKLSKAIEQTVDEFGRIVPVLEQRDDQCTCKNFWKRILEEFLTYIRKVEQEIKNVPNQESEQYGNENPFLIVRILRIIPIVNRNGSKHVE